MKDIEIKISIIHDVGITIDANSEDKAGIMAAMEMMIAKYALENGFHPDKVLNHIILSFGHFAFKELQ